LPAIEWADRSVWRRPLRGFKGLYYATFGEMKVGDLAGVQVYKFKISRQEVFLAYAHDAATITLYLLKLGSHEAATSRSQHRDRCGWNYLGMKLYFCPPSVA